jgi:hypothetical protein
MKMLLSSAAAALVAGFVLNVNAQTTTTGFGTIPGVSGFGTIQGASGDPYSGSGIPFNTSEYEVISGLPGTFPDRLTLAMAATQYKSNPAPGNNGAGTYTVSPGVGVVSPRSTWNWDFYINDANANLASYTYGLTILNVGNGQSFTFDPTLSILGDGGAPSSAGNSESFDFAVFGGPISYNQNANDTYDFTLHAYLNGRMIGSDSITVVAGTGAVPDGANTAILLGAVLTGLTFARGRFARTA